MNKCALHNSDYDYGITNPALQENDWYYWDWEESWRLMRDAKRTLQKYKMNIIHLKSQPYWLGHFRISVVPPDECLNNTTSRLRRFSVQKNHNNSVRILNFNFTWKIKIYHFHSSESHLQTKTWLHYFRVCFHNYKWCFFKMILIVISTQHCGSRTGIFNTILSHFHPPPIFIIRLLKINLKFTYLSISFSVFQVDISEMYQAREIWEM